MSAVFIFFFLIPYFRFIIKYVRYDLNYLEVVDLSVYQRFLANEKIRRMTVLLIIIVVLFLVRSMITTILLTFIFTYLMIHLVQIIQRFIRFQPEY